MLPSDSNTVWKSLSALLIVGAGAGILTVFGPDATGVAQSSDSITVPVDVSDVSAVCAGGPVDPVGDLDKPGAATLIGATAHREVGGASLLSVKADGSFPQALTVAQAPDGLMIDECAPPENLQALVGASTKVQEDSILTITNPSAQPVTVDIAGFGVSGALGGPASSLVIPALSTESSRLGTWFPGEELLGVTVSAEGIGVRAWLQTSGADGEVSTGTTRLPGSKLSDRLAFPLISEKQATPTLLVMNPQEVDATASVSVVRDGAVEPLLGAEGVLVAAGSVTEVSLAGIEEDTYGLVVDGTQPLAAAVSISIEGEKDPVVKTQRIRSRSLTAPSQPVARASVPDLEELKKTLEDNGFTKVDVATAVVDMSGDEAAAVLVTASTPAGVVQASTSLGVLSPEETTQKVQLSPAG